ncbi:uncharacterized protein LOC110811165 [Carica papaya]|uniref:uncharacterized protein LOC110811165 n=1 Tax=Carica papaya TaxID=3649 RepID=UPI000B8C80C9|nr:uncharacterized protein LOC110811165 [Carica papaya]
MDLLVVAAAAAAGYAAKYWQNLSRGRDNLAELSSGDVKYAKPNSPSHPLQRLPRRKKLKENISTDKRKKAEGKFSDTYQSDGALEIEVTSTSGQNYGNYSDYNAFSLSCLQPGFSMDEDPKEKEDLSELSGHVGDACSEPSISEIEMGSFHDSVRKLSSIRNRRPYGHPPKPLSSLESCFMAQLYKEHIKMEEYVLSSLPSPSAPTMRPLLVTDGRQIISRVKVHSFSRQPETRDKKLSKDVHLGKNKYVFGIPPLPKIDSLDLSKKMKCKTAKGCGGGKLSNFSKMVTGKNFCSQDLQNGTVLFSLGISVGIVASLIANKTEVDKLKELLKQTENLVQDLQEELEMKDSLTVRELNDEKDGETLESMSKIEAELEAEFERLGLNVNTSSLEIRLSDIIELEPDFVADFAQGELRVNKLNGQVALSESKKEASDTSTVHSCNCAFSPRELSLRLHEVIQSRLEERVKELEGALQESQRKLEFMESQCRNSSTNSCTNGEARYILPQEIPTREQESNSMVEPLVMNLSGEALDAYNEAYEELMKLNESEEEGSPSTIKENNQDSFDKGTSWAQSSLINGSLSNKDKTYFSSQLRNIEVPSSSIQELLQVGGGASKDQSSDCDDDEMEKMLIQQIVERTKKGSPVVMDAHRVLLSMTENEN